MPPAVKVLNQRPENWPAATAGAPMMPAMGVSIRKNTSEHGQGSCCVNIIDYKVSAGYGNRKNGIGSHNII